MTKEQKHKIVRNDLQASIVRYQTPKYTEHSTNLSAHVGKRLCESFNAQGHGVILREKFGVDNRTFKEDVNTTNAAGAFTTALATTLYEAAIENVQDHIDLVIVNEDLKSMPGAGALKIPKLEPTIAVEVAEGAVVAYFDDGVDSVTATPRKVVAGTALTWEILRRGLSDFTKMVLNNAATSISRKLASDIVGGLAAGAGSSVTGGISYTSIITAYKNVVSASNAAGVKYGFLPDKLVISADVYHTFMLDTDVKEHSYRNPFLAQPLDGLYPAKSVMKWNGMDVLISPFLASTTAHALVLDSKKAAILVKESDLETFEGSLPGRPYDREVVALMSYVLVVLYSSAIVSVTA